MEYQLAKNLNVNPKNIIFNGPSKSKNEIELALREGALINVDSLHEIQLVQTIAESYRNITSKFEVGIRCNFHNLREQKSRFGIDAKSEEFSHAIDLIRKSNALTLGGFHCHLPDRNLSSVIDRVTELVKTTKASLSGVPRFLNIGGGFFGTDLINVSHNPEIPSFKDYASSISKIFFEYYPTKENQPQLILEPGTALVANCFTYWTKVIAIKSINGKKFAIVDGSILEVSPNSRTQKLPAFHLSDRSNLKSTKTEEFSIVGYTCIENDYLTEEYKGEIEVGDFFGYSHVGSYSIVMKPPFIRPAAPIIEVDDSYECLQVIRETQSLENIFAGFKL
jgi:diaminopimelate decarboxylase